LLYFFFKEILLDKRLVGHVDPVKRADQVIDLMSHAGPYHLLVIDAAHCRQESTRLISWLNRQSMACPIILILPSTTSSTFSLNHTFISLHAPVDLLTLITSAQAVLNKVEPYSRSAG
jgi:hypothetical protein